MKNNKKRLLSIFLVLLLAFSMVSCGMNKDGQSEAPATDTGVVTDAVTDAADTEKIAADGLWADALYRSDKTFGEGAKTIEVEVKADDKSVTFTIKTDKANLGEALLEHKLVEGEQGAYGLYIKKVNGILADYDVDKHYWSISKAGTALMTGADGENIAGGEHYEFVRTK
ncbi:MAG: hypothetical protein IJE84_02260 [Clostridia bacterium]|nr:hypothetical protein [Clostridia bacterium]